MEIISHTAKLPGLTVVGKINLSKTSSKKRSNGKKRFFKPFSGGYTLGEVWKNATKA